jgi:hypothetical protein
MGAACSGRGGGQASACEGRQEETPFSPDGRARIVAATKPA